jgi:hypothetical protein
MQWLGNGKQNVRPVTSIAERLTFWVMLYIRVKQISTMGTYWVSKEEELSI